MLEWAQICTKRKKKEKNCPTICTRGVGRDLRNEVSGRTRRAKSWQRFLGSKFPKERALAAVGPNETKCRALHKKQRRARKADVEPAGGTNLLRMKRTWGREPAESRIRYPSCPAGVRKKKNPRCDDSRTGQKQRLPPQNVSRRYKEVAKRGINQKKGILIAVGDPRETRRKRYRGGKRGDSCIRLIRVATIRQVLPAMAALSMRNEAREEGKKYLLGLLRNPRMVLGSNLRRKRRSHTTGQKSSLED